MGRGTYKYICEECQAENWLTAGQRNSRFKPRCIECGSIRLSPSSGSRGPDKLAKWDVAKEKRSDIQDKKMGKK